MRGKNANSLTASIIALMRAHCVTSPQGISFTKRPAPHPGEWDNFRVPNIGLAVQRRLAQQSRGSERKLRQAFVTSVSHALRVKPKDLSASGHRFFSDLALVLAMIPDLSRWSKEEKSAVKQIVQAKTGTDELRYVKLLQRNQKLRDGLRAIGSREVIEIQ